MVFVKREKLVANSLLIADVLLVLMVNAVIDVRREIHNKNLTFDFKVISRVLSLVYLLIRLVVNLVNIFNV
jgi:hypothetical protein